MKFAVSSRQVPSYKLRCHELIVEYEDRKIIPECAQFYPEKRVKLNLHLTHNVDWQEIEDYYHICNHLFIVSIAYPEDYLECKARKIPFLFGSYVDTFDKLTAVKEAGAAEVLIGGQLFFDLQRVKTFGIPVRLTVNKAITDVFPRADGICGSYIRPEDLDKYEDLVSIVEFQHETLEQEQAYFRIYAQQHKWDGPVSMIIQDVGDDKAMNRMIPPEFAERRLNCSQRCKRGISCQLCNRYFHLANPEVIKPIKEQIELEKLIDDTRAANRDNQSNSKST